MNEGALILAYHGCDITVRDRLVKGTLARLKPSVNCYDWLGDGVYFFEGDAERAFGFADASHRAAEKLLSARPIVTPSVVGAVLAVSRCWDMTTVSGQRIYQSALAELRVSRDLCGRPMPVNRAADLEDETVLLRGLDRAVFNIGHQMLERDGQPPFQMVRAAFYQGRPIVDGGEFRSGTHLQLALRDQQCVIGWFLPKGVGSALLSDRELVEAEAAMTRALGARTANKPRMRALP